jgi:hypothetical protein
VFDLRVATIGEVSALSLREVDIWIDEAIQRGKVKRG